MSKIAKAMAAPVRRYFNPRFESLNVEGVGFGGAVNLLTEPAEFGTVQRLCVTIGIHRGQQQQHPEFHQYQHGSLPVGQLQRRGQLQPLVRAGRQPAERLQSHQLVRTGGHPAA